MTQLGELYTLHVCTRPNVIILSKPSIIISITVYFFAGRRRPQVSVEEFGFLEKIFQKTKPEERTWAKLVNPKTIHWYCDGPEPTREAIIYDERVHRRKSVNFYFFEISLQLE